MELQKENAPLNIKIFRDEHGVINNSFTGVTCEMLNVMVRALAVISVRNMKDGCTVADVHRDIADALWGAMQTCDKEERKNARGKN